MTESGPVLAIVLPDLYQASVTFFHEHIANILPGRTVVVHLSAAGETAQTNVAVLELPMAAPWRVPALPVLSTAVRQVNTWRANRLSRVQRRAVVDFLQLHRVTHVFAEFATCGTTILPVAEQLGLPLTVMSHGWDINVVGQALQWRWRYRRLFSSDARLCAVMPFLRDRMVEIGAPRDRIAIVPCAVDTGYPAVRHDGDRCTVVMVSRLTAQKGPLDSLRAFALAAAENSGITLEVVGNGPLMPELRAAVDRLGLGDRVILHGDLPHDRTLDVIAKGHIFLQHCRTLPRQGIESQAVSLLEAMAHGLVPIVTRHGGMTDHVTVGERGWLIEEGDVAGMSRHIIAMAQAPDERVRIGANARDYVARHYARDVVYPRLRQVIGLTPAESSFRNPTTKPDMSAA